MRDAIAAWLAGVRAVEPAAAVRSWLRNHRSFDPSAKSTLVVATGKAAASMARALDAGVRGFVLVPRGTDVAGLPPGLKVLYGEHPIPGTGSIDSANEILSAVSALSAGDRLLYLVSGGSSALFEAPLPHLAPDDVAAAYRLLLSSGADIAEMNVVRCALSLVKGGGLLHAAAPAPVTTLAVSDVAGDDPATIGSGPTVAVADRSDRAFRILTKYGLAASMPPAIVAACRSSTNAYARREGGGSGLGESAYDVILSVSCAEDAARARLTAAGYEIAAPPVARLTGDAAAIASRIVACVASMRGRARDCAFVVGGETTVRLPATVGSGGRNQHLAAIVARDLAGVGGFACMVGGTDGRDGNSDAAGGLVHGSTLALARRHGADLASAIERFDTTPALRAAGAAVRTGASGTNVGDLLVVASTRGAV